MTKNNIKKTLIETLTKTHSNASIAYILAKNKLKNEADKEHLNRIAKKFNIKI